MVICVDFDNTIVKEEHRYDDLDTPLQFVDGAREGLLSLKRAGHILVLYSGRANKALLCDPSWNPLVKLDRIDPQKLAVSLRVNQRRYLQMRQFVARELPGVFSVLDAGAQGKPSADLYIDDKAVRLGPDIGGLSWAEVSQIYGG